MMKNHLFLEISLFNNKNSETWKFRLYVYYFRWKPVTFFYFLLEKGIDIYRFSFDYYT